MLHLRHKWLHLVLACSWYCCTGRTQLIEWMELLLHVCDSTSDSTNPHIQCVGQFTGLNQCGKLEKAKKRRALGPDDGFQRASDPSAVNHASSFHSVELFVRLADTVWRQGESTTGHARCAPLPKKNKKLGLAYPKHLWGALGHFTELQAFIVTLLVCVAWYLTVDGLIVSAPGSQTAHGTNLICSYRYVSAMGSQTIVTYWMFL